MKNVKLKIKNEGEDGKWGSEEESMVTGGWGVPAQCGVRNAEGAMNTEGDLICRGGKAEFEVLRLKTDFRFEGHPEGWTPSGEENGRNRENANIEHPTSNAEQRMEDGEARTKNRNDEEMAIGVLCWLLLPSRLDCLGSPGKSAVAGNLAGAVHDALVQNCRFPGQTRLNSLKLARTLILNFFLKWI